MLRAWILMAGLAAVLCAQNDSAAGQRGVKLPVNRPALNGRTYALLIGVSNYQNVGSLQYADKDAETFAALLAKPVGGSLPPDQMLLLTNEKATRAGIDDGVKNFVLPHAGADNTLILFVAAHGVFLKTEQDPVTHVPIGQEPFILTYESNPQDAKTTGYPMDEFRSMVAGQAANYGRVLVFVDVCHAANVSGIAGLTQAEPQVRRVFEGRAGELGLMMATQAADVAFESKSFGGGHGAFSYFVISGLNGAAADEGDSIMFLDLAKYVETNVDKFTLKQQQTERYATDLHMVLVNDVHREGIHLEPAAKLTPDEVQDVRRRRSTSSPAPPAAAAPAASDPFDSALAHGLLLPEQPGSAANLLAQARRDPQQTPTALRDRERRLHIALDDRGQQIMSRYLEGDQVPQVKADFEQCARYFEEASALEPSDDFDRGRALFCRGRAQVFDRQYDTARRTLEESIRMDSRRAYAYNALGIAFLEDSARTGQGLTEAAAAFRSAMRYAPYWAYPVHNLALLETERGNYDQAIRLYAQAMAVAPAFSYLPYNLGLLYERMGDLNRANRWYVTARQIAENSGRHTAGPWPERSQIWNALGTVARSQGRQSKASDLFEKSLADDPSNRDARHNLAAILAQRGDLARADQLWKLNLAQEPKFLPSWVAYAESLAARGSSAEAVREFESIVAAKPDYVGAREALARLYVSQRNAPAALMQLEAALKLSPANSSLLELRGDAELLAGRNDAARQDFTRSLTSAPNGAARSRIKRKLAALR
jgi:tetratricopeptide (TPR) repeat protein